MSAAAPVRPHAGRCRRKTFNDRGSARSRRRRAQRLQYRRCEFAKIDCASSHYLNELAEWGRGLRVTTGRVGQIHRHQSVSGSAADNERRRDIPRITAASAREPYLPLSKAEQPDERQQIIKFPRDRCFWRAADPLANFSGVLGIPIPVADEGIAPLWHQSDAPRINGWLLVVTIAQHRNPQCREYLTIVPPAVDGYRHGSPRQVVGNSDIWIAK